MTIIRKQLIADIALLAVVIVWGYTFVAIKNAIAIINPFSFMFVRFMIAFIIISLIFIRRFRRMNIRTAAAGSLIGSFLYVAYLTQTMGLKYTTASNAGFITGFSVVLVPIFSSILLKKKPGIESIIGVVCAFCGLILLSYSGTSSINKGDLLVFICAVSVSFHILTTGYYARKYDAILLTIVQIGTVAMLTFISALLFGELSIPRGRVVWSALIVCSLFATVGAYLVQTSMQRFTSSTHTALIFSGEPVFAGIFGYFLLGEKLGTWAIAGCFLILAGMIVSELKFTGREDDL